MKKKSNLQYHTNETPLARRFVVGREGYDFSVITYPEMSQEFQDEDYSVTRERKFLQRDKCLQATRGSP